MCCIIYGFSHSACTSASLEPSYVLRAIGAEEDLAHSSIRFGISRFTTEAEIDYTADKCAQQVNRLREMRLVSSLLLLSFASNPRWQKAHSSLKSTDHIGGPSLTYLSMLVGMHQLNISSVCDWFVEGSNGNLILTCSRSRHNISSPDLFTIKVQVNEIFTIQFLTRIHRKS